MTEPSLGPMSAEPLASAAQPVAPATVSPTAPVPLLELEHLRVWFPIRTGGFGGTKRFVRAVDDVTFTLYQGETLGLVGESGCGKTTLARTLIRLNKPTGGGLRFRGEDLVSKSNRGLRDFRRQVQMVFQDPQTSLNPRKRVGQIVGAAVRLRGGAARTRKADVLEAAASRWAWIPATPSATRTSSRAASANGSVSPARSAPSPKLIILDEPVSALDVSVQAQVVNLLDDLQDDLGLSYIFVAHDLSVVRHVSDRIAVMYLGKIVELSPADTLYKSPKHPYTASLLDAIPIPDPDRVRQHGANVARGELPSPINPPPGCRFNTRCPYATDLCREVEPPLAQYPEGHLAACHHPLNVTADELAGAVRSDSSPLEAGQELTLTPTT